MRGSLGLPGALLVLLPFIVPRIQFDRTEAAHGVDTMFTLSGAHVFPLYDAAVGGKAGVEGTGGPLRLVDVRHEQTAVFAAEGLAKLTPAPASPTPSAASPPRISTARRWSCSVVAPPTCAGAPARCRSSTSRRSSRP